MRKGGLLRGRGRSQVLAGCRLLLHAAVCPAGSSKQAWKWSGSPSGTSSITSIPSEACGTAFARQRCLDPRGQRSQLLAMQLLPAPLAAGGGSVGSGGLSRNCSLPAVPPWGTGAKQGSSAACSVDRWRGCRGWSVRSGREALLSKPTRGHKVRFNSPVLPQGVPPVTWKLQLHTFYLVGRESCF